MKFNVALRKESVDRNVDPDKDTLTDDVALRKESVDRNRNSQYSYFLFYGSLSARRAWIEMHPLVLISPKIGCRSPQGERG